MARLSTLSLTLFFTGRFSQLALGLLVLSVALPGLALEFGPGTLLTKEIEFVASDSANPPAKDAAWQPIQLPLFRSSPPFEDMDDQESLWFRVPLEKLLTNSPELQSLYIWRHNMRLAVYLDDVRLGGTLKTHSNGWASMGWNHPVLVDLPFVKSLDNKETTVYLKVEGGPGGIILSPLLSGSRDTLQAAFDKRYLTQVDAARWSFFLCLLLTVLSIWLWAQRRTETMFLRYAAMTGLTAVTTSFFFLDYIPFNLHLWLFVQHAASDWITFFMISYFAMALEQPWRAVRRIVLAVASSATLAYALVPAAILQPLAYSIHALLSLVVFGLGLRIFYITWRSPNGTRMWFSIATLGFFVINGHDFAAVFLSTPEEYIRASNWLQFSAPLMALAFFAHLVHRFVAALEVSENLNRDLEKRVEASRQALELSFAKNREMELAHTADAERQRIYRELHDDLGSKLVSIVHSAEGSRQGELARSALESLRESIYRARHRQQTLSECLTAVVNEARLRLTGGGLELEAEIPELNGCNIPPDFAYNLTRIVREGISNILQHARASRAYLNVERDPKELRIILGDDGIADTSGFFASGGLDNIRFRAERIGANVAWVPGNPGCELILSLPLEPNPGGQS